MRLRVVPCRLNLEYESVMGHRSTPKDCLFLILTFNIIVHIYECKK